MSLDEDLKKLLLQGIHEQLNAGTTIEEIFKEQRTESSRQWKVHDGEGDAESHQHYSEIVVRPEKKPGFLYLLRGILAKPWLNVELCKCYGLGGRTIHRFYVKLIDDPELTHQQIGELKQVCTKSNRN